MLRCPVCRTPLARQRKNYRCDRGHSFDIARSGYVNLLRSGSRRSRGDDARMLRSRRAFLERGFYQPLLSIMAGRTSTRSQGSPLRLLDVGCGEGYFTAGLAQGQVPGSEVWGVDISRLAVDMGARRHPRLGFAVASARDLPILTGAVDFLACIFGPHEPLEYRRVLAAAGLAIIVRPGADHLIELRRMLYRDLQPPGRRDDSDAWEGLRVVERSELRYSMQLREEDRLNLLAMTPYTWSGGKDSQLLALTAAEVTAHFQLVEVGPD